MLHRVNPDPLARKFEAKASQALFRKTVGEQGFARISCVEQVFGCAVASCFVAFRPRIIAHPAGKEVSRDQPLAARAVRVDMISIFVEEAAWVVQVWAAFLSIHIFQHRIRIGVDEMLVAIVTELGKPEPLLDRLHQPAVGWELREEIRIFFGPDVDQEVERFSGRGFDLFDKGGIGIGKVQAVEGKPLKRFARIVE